MKLIYFTQKLNTYILSQNTFQYQLQSFPVYSLWFCYKDVFNAKMKTALYNTLDRSSCGVVA